MATARTATIEELAKLASDFVTRQKGLWDHAAWTDFLASVRSKGFDLSGEMQENLGNLLEAMKQFYTAASATGSIEKAMKTIADDSVAFVKQQKGVWGHSEWEQFLKTIKKNTVTYSEGATTYLGGVLESFRVFYSATPTLPGRKPASAAQKKPPSASRSAPAAKKKIASKPASAKIEAKPSPKGSNKKDDLTAIDGIGPALAKKLNAAGVVSYSQIAALSKAEIENLEKNIIKFSGRITRDDWVGQAKKLTGNR